MVCCLTGFGGKTKRQMEQRKKAKVILTKVWFLVCLHTTRHSRDSIARTPSVARLLGWWFAGQRGGRAKHIATAPTYRVVLRSSLTRQCCSARATPCKRKTGKSLARLRQNGKLYTRSRPKKHLCLLSLRKLRYRHSPPHHIQSTCSGCPLTQPDLSEGKSQLHNHTIEISPTPTLSHPPSTPAHRPAHPRTRSHPGPP